MLIGCSGFSIPDISINEIKECIFFILFEEFNLLKSFDANGSHTVFQGRTGTNGRAWAGTLEYEVLVPGTPNQYRILKQQTGVDASGVPTYRYGYSTDHYQTAIHEFKPVQSTPPPSPPAP